MGRRGRRLTMVLAQPPRGVGGSREPWLRLQEHKLRPKTYPHGFPTRRPLEIVGEPLHRAGSRETTSGLAELGEEWGRGVGVSSWNRPPAPCCLKEIICVPRNHPNESLGPFWTFP